MLTLDLEKLDQLLGFGVQEEKTSPVPSFHDPEHSIGNSKLPTGDKPLDPNTRMTNAEVQIQNLNKIAIRLCEEIRTTRQSLTELAARAQMKNGANM